MLFAGYLERDAKLKRGIGSLGNARTRLSSPTSACLWSIKLGRAGRLWVYDRYMAEKTISPSAATKHSRTDRGTAIARRKACRSLQYMRWVPRIEIFRCWRLRNNFASQGIATLREARARKQRGLLLTTKDTKGVAFYAPRHAVPKKKLIWGGSIVRCNDTSHGISAYPLPCHSWVASPYPFTSYQLSKPGLRQEKPDIKIELNCPVES